MGRVLAEIRVENIRDLYAAEEDRLEDSDVRRVDLDDALVDTGATTLALPTNVIEQLGLNLASQKQATSSQGLGPVNIYEAVRLTLIERQCTVDVVEVPNEVPASIGQIPLGILDLVVDLQGQRLVGNPAHGGEQVLELY
jgi:predicted aspartyl protease